MAPTPETAANALNAVQLPANLVAFITDPEGAQSYPIVIYTWILADDKYEERNEAKAFQSVIE